MKECRFCGGDLSVAEHLDQNHKWGNCIDLWTEEIVEGLENTEKLGEELKTLSKKISQKYSMNTLDAHEQTLSAYRKAADEILDFTSVCGFTSEQRHDVEFLKHTIAGIIQKNIEGNTTYGPSIR